MPLFGIDPAKTIGQDVQDGNKKNNNKEKGEKEMKRLMSFLKDEEGATAVEYGIMVAAIAAVIIAVVFIVGLKVENAFEVVNAELP